MKKDYIPRKESDFAGWEAHYVEIIATDPASFGIEPAELAKLAKLAKWEKICGLTREHPLNTRIKFMAKLSWWKISLLRVRNILL